MLSERQCIIAMNIPSKITVIFGVKIEIMAFSSEKMEQTKLQLINESVTTDD